MKQEHVTIIYNQDWAAVYVGDRLVHYHDTPSPETLLGLLGVTHATEEVAPQFERDRDFTFPQSLAEYRRMRLEAEVKMLERERDALRGRLAEVERGLLDESGERINLLREGLLALLTHLPYPPDKVIADTRVLLGLPPEAPAVYDSWRLAGSGVMDPVVTNAAGQTAVRDLQGRWVMVPRPGPDLGH